MSVRKKSACLVLFPVILVFCFSGCVPALYCGLKNTDGKQLLSGGMNGIFRCDTCAVVFKTKIWIFGKYFSGILAIKQIENSATRTVFMNEVGLKIFDFEFLPAQQKGVDFIVHQCLEIFNRKEMINIIEDDLRLLFTRYLPEPARVYSSKRTNCTVYCFTEGRYSSYYFAGNDDGLLRKIEKTGCVFKKVIINFFDYKDDIPMMIRVEHKNIRLKIEFVNLSD